MTGTYHGLKKRSQNPIYISIWDKILFSDSLYSKMAERSAIYFFHSCERHRYRRLRSASTIKRMLKRGIYPNEIKLILLLFYNP